MYFSQISAYTKEHLLSHLPVLLANEQTKYSDTIRLVMPKAVDVSSLIGGIMAIAQETLPQYAIDCTSKSETELNSSDLYLYDYTGQLAYLVNGSDANVVQEISRRHAAVLEQFCKSHQIFHQHSDTDGFTIVAFECVSVDLQGPMELIVEKKGNIWVAGGSLDLIWTVSETGYFQHGS